MTETLWFAAPSEFERVRRLNMSEVERASLFADLCRLNTLSMIAYAGSGHIGSSFSSLDIVTWLFLHELGNTNGSGVAPDLYYSSKGHDAPGLYAAMIALGRLPADNARKLRRLGGLPGHPDIVSTPEIVTNTGSLGMGISKAKGMVFADKLMGRRRRIFVLTIVVEEAVDAREIECAVIGNNAPRASLPGEYVVHDEAARFLDYTEKYTKTGHVEFVVPAPVPKSLATRMQKMAIKAFQAIDGSGLARVDFFLRRNSNELLINELNTMPGLTEVSGYPKMWAASGLSYTKMLDVLVELALERHREKALNQTDP